MLGWVELAGWCIVTVLLIAAFVYDLRYMMLPDQFMLPAIAIAALILGLNAYTYGLSSVVPQLIATAVFGGAYFALWFLSGGKFLGDGDIRLAVVMGLLLSVPQLLVAVFVAYLVGALLGVGLIVTKQKKRTDPVAFGPFLILGLYAGLFFGTQVSNWYLGLF
jgi:leader peptidase (prepilin peptidase)/N-methyltransferase